MTRSALSKRAVLPTALMMISGLMLGLAPTPASAGTDPPPVTEVTIDDDRTITMNTTLAPGLNAFHITSTKGSDFQLGIRAPGYSKKEMASDVNAPSGTQRPQGAQAVREERHPAGRRPQLALRGGP